MEKISRGGAGAQSTQRGIKGEEKKEEHHIEARKIRMGSTNFFS